MPRGRLYAALIAVLLLMLACQGETPPDSSSADQPQADSLKSQELEKQLETALQEREKAQRTARLRGQDAQRLVTDFLNRYQWHSLSEPMRETLSGLGIDPQQPESYLDVDSSKLVPLATVHAFFEAFPYPTLPPELSRRFREMGIDPDEPDTFIEADLIEFARATAGFAWDSHLWQVKAQKLANRRGEEIDQLSNEKSRLGRDLQAATHRLGALDREVEGLQQALSSEKHSHHKTRQAKGQVEDDYAQLQSDASAERRQAEERLQALADQKAALERTLELERRGEHFSQAWLTAQRLLDQYERVLEEMDKYYQRRQLLVTSFVYELNADGSVTGIDKQTGYENHPVWVRAEPGEVEERYFERHWKAFRHNVKQAIHTARKARKKSDYQPARELSGQLEEMLRQIPEDLWISVKTPSGGRYRLDLTPQVDPLMQQLASWRHL
ncbi:MAG TPA: hypothetical protein VLU25_18900 [Acidobacteriota bacterium]|nr:hypothetical protein [Acidobacteriota bacterium]